MSTTSSASLVDGEDLLPDFLHTKPNLKLSPYKSNLMNTPIIRKLPHTLLDMSSVAKSEEYYTAFQPVLQKPTFTKRLSDKISKLRALKSNKIEKQLIFPSPSVQQKLAENVETTVKSTHVGLNSTSTTHQRVFSSNCSSSDDEEGRMSVISSSSQIHQQLDLLVFKG